MSLFNKKKDEVPVAPPMPPIGAGVGNSQQNEFMLPPINEMNNLSAPPIPGGSLEDIKSQVSRMNTIVPIQNTNQMTMTNVPAKNEEIPDISLKEDNFEDDSLFDFSELESETTKALENTYDKKNNSNEQVQENLGNLEDLNFIKSNKRLKEHNHTYFITTKQFKKLLEIVDEVKRKTKESQETHLRLLDIKSEEDIEYENLRKDFEYIEDKLYELDSIIFEK